MYIEPKYGDKKTEVLFCDEDFARLIEKYMGSDARKHFDCILADFESDVEDSYEYGVECGCDEGFTDGHEKGVKEGYERGYDAGYNDARERMYDDT